MAKKYQKNKDFHYSGLGLPECKICHMIKTMARTVSLKLKILQKLNNKHE